MDKYLFVRFLRFYYLCTRKIFARVIKKSARDGASFEKNAYLCTVVINWRRIARSSKQRSTGKPGKFTLSDKEQSLRGASPMTNSCTPAPCGSGIGITYRCGLISFFFITGNSRTFQ